MRFVAVVCVRLSPLGKYEFAKQINQNEIFLERGTYFEIAWCVWVLVAQLCPTLCDPTDCNLPGSSLQGIFTARLLEWIVFPVSGDLPNPGIEPINPASPSLAGRFFTTEPSGNLRWF